MTVFSKMLFTNMINAIKKSRKKQVVVISVIGTIIALLKVKNDK